MLTRSLSLDLAAYDIHAVSMHPGWVKTDLVRLVPPFLPVLRCLHITLAFQGGPNAPLSAGESVAGMLNVLQDFKPGMNGGFFDYEGNCLAW